MKNSFLKVFLIVILIFSLSISFVGCNKDDNSQNENVESVPTNDGDYFITLKGLIDVNGNNLDDVVITKTQIKQLFDSDESKQVVYDANNPCYASDKTDDNGNKIPHTLLGVYLEDLLTEYTSSDVITAYGSLTLNATDNYVTVATEEVFNSAGRGSKMIIAFNYDGKNLTENNSSGALRAVFPNQIANVWAKKLKSIEFSTEILTSPKINKITVLESLNDSFAGQYSTTITQNDNSFNMTYYGLSISKLLTDPTILSANKTDKMYVCAWDYNDATSKYEEYSTWTKYDVYSKGYLLTKQQREQESIVDMTRKPVFDGPAFNEGMTVKNILAIEVYKTSIVSFYTAMLRFDADGNGQTDGKFAISDLLRLMNMWDDDNSYTVTSLDGTNKLLTYSQMQSAKVTLSGDNYVLLHGNESLILKSISIAIK